MSGKQVTSSSCCGAELMPSKSDPRPTIVYTYQLTTIVIQVIHQRKRAEERKLLLHQHISGRGNCRAQNKDRSPYCGCESPFRFVLSVKCPVAGHKSHCPRNPEKKLRWITPPFFGYRFYLVIFQVAEYRADTVHATVRYEVTGLVVVLMASQNVCSPTWLRSTIIPSSFMRCTICLPRSFKSFLALCSFSLHRSPEASGGEAESAPNCWREPRRFVHGRSGPGSRVIPGERHVARAAFEKTVRSSRACPRSYVHLPPRSWPPASTITVLFPEFGRIGDQGYLIRIAC